MIFIETSDIYPLQSKSDFICLEDSWTLELFSFWEENCWWYSYIFDQHKGSLFLTPEYARWKDKINHKLKLSSYLFWKLFYNLLKMREIKAQNHGWDKKAIYFSWICFLLIFQFSDTNICKGWLSTVSVTKLFLDLNSVW